MKLLLASLGVLGLVLSSMPLLAVPAAAERPGASATATAHALDELANAIAQGKITRTPTPTTSPTATPTATPVPTATPADSPAPTATPDPPLPVPGAGQALAAYVRPSPRDPSQVWLELAAPQGRWAVVYDTAQCVPPSPWTDVWLALDDASTRPITAERSGTGMCALAQWAWTSDVPCATDGDGVCDAAADPAGWPPAAAEPPPDTPAPRPTPPPTVVPAAPTIRAAPAPPPPVPQVQVVVQTVVVTAVPTDTPVPEPTVATAPVLARATARATPSPAPTGLASAALLRQSSPVPALVRQGTPRPTAEVRGVQVAAPAPFISPAPDRAGLVVVIAIGLALAAGLIAVAATLIRRRRYAPS